MITEHTKDQYLPRNLWKPVFHLEKLEVALGSYYSFTAWNLLERISSQTIHSEPGQTQYINSIIEWVSHSAGKRLKTCPLGSSIFRSTPPVQKAAYGKSSPRVTQEFPFAMALINISSSPGITANPDKVLSHACTQINPTGMRPVLPEPC